MPDGFLWADANGGMDRVSALELAPKLAKIGVDVLEQPLPSNSLTGYRALKKQAALNGPQFLDASVLKQPLIPEKGKLAVPKGPGLGVEVDEEKVRQLAVDL